MFKLSVAFIFFLLFLFIRECLAEESWHPYEDELKLTCDSISLIHVDRAADLRQSLFKQSAVKIAGCDRIARVFVDERGRPYPLTRESDDIGIYSHYLETQDKFCRALLDNQGGPGNSRANACRFGFPLKGETFRYLTELARNGILPVLGVDTQVFADVAPRSPSFCVPLPLGREATANPALSRALTARFGEGAGWEAISSRVAAEGARPDDMTGFDFSQYYVTSFGRQLPPESAQYHGDTIGFTITLGIAEKIPVGILDIGCASRLTCNPNYVCVLAKFQ